MSLGASAISGISNTPSQLINGLHVGSIYALIALGYTMVYGIIKLINFAHGDIIMVGAYTAVITLVSLNWSPVAALIAAIVVCVLLGLTIERVAYKPLRSSPRISSLITAIGVSMLLQNAALLLFGAQPRPFPIVLKVEPLRFGGLQISFITLLTLGVTALLMIGLQTFVPLFLIADLDVSTATAGAALTVLLAFGALGTLVGGRVAERVGNRPILVVCMAVLTPLVLPLAMRALRQRSLRGADRVPVG